MGFSKETAKSRQLLLRSVKTLFFLFNMFFSLVLSAAPIFLILLDAVLPSALLSAQTHLSPHAIYSHFTNYSFRSSLIDIPLISLLRSALILCFYTLCDGPALSRAPYLGMAVTCSVSSLLFVSYKASFVFRRWDDDDLYYDVRGVEMALFVCSWVLAVGHMVVAYRTSCRHRRKMLIYNIDIEAVTSYKKGFFKYQKLIEEERMRKNDNNKLGK